MPTRSLLVAVAVPAAVLLGPHAAHAQQSLALNIGQFSVRGADARIDDDVVLENLNLFSFELSELNSVTFGGEWLIGLGDHLEAGVGLGFQRGSAPSTYIDFVNYDGTEILQDFHLQMVPLTGTLRLFPFGDTPIRPYVGGGVGLFIWRYSEVGQFIDFSVADQPVFADRFVATGTDVGAVVLGGVRVPFGSRYPARGSRYAAGVEVQYQRASGRVGVDEGFLAERIDLGGLTTRFTFQIGF